MEENTVDEWKVDARNGKQKKTYIIYEPPHDKTNKMACAPSEDWDQPGHPPSLISVFAVRMKKAWVLSYPLSAQRRLIRLDGWPGWSESSLGAQSVCLFCHEAAHIHVISFKGAPGRFSFHFSEYEKCIEYIRKFRWGRFQNFGKKWYILDFFFFFLLISGSSLKIREVSHV